jgi:hypothetical protein
MTPSFSHLAALLARLRPHLRIAHRIPGRVRLKLSPGVVGAVPVGELTPALSTLTAYRGVGEARVNLAALSAIVGYDPSVIADSFWEDCLSVPVEELEALLSATLRPRTEITPP